MENYEYYLEIYKEVKDKYFIACDKFKELKHTGKLDIKEELDWHLHIMDLQEELSKYAEILFELSVFFEVDNDYMKGEIEMFTKINENPIPITFEYEYDDGSFEFEFEGERYALDDIIRVHNNPWVSDIYPEYIHGEVALSYLPRLFVEFIEDEGEYGSVNIYKFEEEPNND